MNDWKEIKLGDICTSISKTYKSKSDKVILINTSDILNGAVLNHSYVENKNIKGQFKKTFRENDILYSEIRPKNKRFAYINFDPTDYIASTKLMVIRPNTVSLDSKFLYNILTSSSVIKQLQSIAELRSGTFPQITFNEVAELEISLPPLQEQKAISSILSALDDKIEINNKINETLEEMAQAIFNDTFMNTSIGSNFIGELITPKRGKGLLSKDAVLGNVPVIAGGLEPATYHNVANTIEPVLTISASGANAGFVNLWGIPVWSSDSSFIDSTMTDDVYFWYVLLKNRQKEIFDAQTGSAQPHIYPKHIASMPICAIEQEQIRQFTKLVTPMFQTIGNNKQQNIYLASIRDSLLPKLMSGEFDVSNIEI